MLLNTHFFNFCMTFVFEIRRLNKEEFMEPLYCLETKFSESKNFRMKWGKTATVATHSGQSGPDYEGWNELMMVVENDIITYKDIPRLQGQLMSRGEPTRYLRSRMIFLGEK